MFRQSSKASSKCGIGYNVGLSVDAKLTMPTHFDAYEKHAQWLEKIANTLETNSPEFVALERAGWALAFVTMRHHHEFRAFLEEKIGN
jgi:hypothetical protein